MRIILSEFGLLKVNQLGFCAPFERGLCCGLVRIIKGLGREYFEERSQICRNQEREEGLEFSWVLAAWRWRMMLGSRRLTKQ